MEPDHRIKLISCRICRNSASSKVSFELNSEWSSLFEFCLGFQISQNGPQTFCKNCSDKLREYGTFKHLCLQSEEMWKSMTNSIPICYVNKSNILKEEKNDYPKYELDENVKEDIFDHEDNDYDIIWVVKEDREEKVTNLVKKLDELTEISITKIEHPFSENEISIEKKCPKVKTKKGKTIKRCKYEEKEDNKHLLSVSKNNSNVTAKEEATNFSCGLCEFTSISSLDVNQHLVQHCQENILKCLLCNFEGKDVAHMIYHRYTHFQIKTEKPTDAYKCPMCSEKFFNAYKLQYHYRSAHLKKKGGLCVFCERAYISYKRWKLHERAHVSKNYICDHCGKSFLQRYEIINHMDMHYGTIRYICDVCGKVFTTLSNLKDHIYYNHKDHKKVSCSICKRVLKNSDHLKKHIKEQHGPKNFLCKVCSKSYCTKSSLRKHINYNHSGERSYVCDLCGAKYRSNMSLKIHKRKHTGELPYKCQECGKGFTNSRACKTHQSVHTGVRPKDCLYCNKTFYSKKQMQVHCNSKHKKSLNYHTYYNHKDHKKVTCTVCKRKFKNPVNLRKHIRIAHGQKKYLCEICSKGFCTNRSLRMHIYYNHSDERPHVCDLCGAKYRSSMSLNIHKRKHTGELPYKCQECGKGFTNYSACKRHKSVHTGVRSVKCLYCDKTFYSKKQMQMHCNSKHKSSQKNIDLNSYFKEESYDLAR